MSFTDEFQTVDLLRAEVCNAVNRGVDAFALAVIKAERQARKLFTFLVYQYPAFTSAHILPLRDALALRRDIYFKGFLRGIDTISPVTPVSRLVGADFAALSKSLHEATQIRNKIFHGQITTRQLGREDLFRYVDQIRTWCERLAASSKAEFGYDGFARDSFQKAASSIDSRLRQPPLTTVAEYSSLLDLLR